MKTRILLVQVVTSVLGLIVGHFVVGLFAHNHTAQFLGAATCAILAMRALPRAKTVWVLLVVPGAARALAQILFRAPEGGKLPKGLPREARQVDQAMVTARVMLRRRKPERLPFIVEHTRVGVRQAAKNATIAGHADAVREILLFREPCAGPPDIQAAWVQVLATAHEGIADGETTTPTASPSAG
jgi:hypothetical protein